LKRTLIVTGASRGLGRYIAEKASVDGWHVVGVARKPFSAETFETRVCDISDFEAVKALFGPFRRSNEFFGLINVAGIASMNLVLTTPPATMEKIVRTNLLGTIYCSQAAAKILARRKQGRIINFSTIAVFLAIKGEAVYASSKAAVETFSRIFAREMAEHHITVNTIAPGPIDTDLIAKVPKAKITEIVSRQIIPEMAQPADVYDIVCLLLSKKGAWITGSVIPVGGV